MKKILLILALCFINPVFAQDWDSAEAIKRVNTIGNKLLKANGIQHDIKFNVSNEDSLIPSSVFSKSALRNSALLSV